MSQIPGAPRGVVLTSFWRKWSEMIGPSYATMLAKRAQSSLISLGLFLTAGVFMFLVIALDPGGNVLFNLVAIPILLATGAWLIFQMLRYLWLGFLISRDMRAAGFAIGSAANIRSLELMDAWCRQNAVTPADVIAVGSQKYA